ncbi:hypothetical protein PENSTE_c008G08905 [Penicillium steckii]|uniref:Allergen Asp f 4 n=1 Tax=Penicillium steckii TaxID=303698 RepID=A0A1V6TBH4_9EURO|nr:hypothetical protein PENSTE_c008G08905 [Penicillium steckii]
MRSISSFVLLAALTSGAVARHGHHVRHEGHMRRQADVDSTTTVTTTSTVTYCPCEDSTSSVIPSSTPIPSTPASIELTTSLSLATQIQVSYSSVTPVVSIPTTTSTIIELPTTSTYTPVPTTTEVPTSTYTPSSSTSSTPSTSSSGANADWSTVPSNGVFSTSGFGASTNSSGSGVSYTGNVGSPYGSNIISVEASEASNYQYVVEFTGSNTEDWYVVIWNKIGKDGKMDGWYGNACHEFSIGAGETKYYAFDSNSQGGWAAAKGSSIPTDDYGGYAATWGEFDFGSTTNSGWSGFDVSAIQAQNADLTVQGMKICSVYDDDTCSSITSGLAAVVNAYTSALAKEDGIGGNLNTDAVRLAVTLDYSA